MGIIRRTERVRGDRVQISPAQTGVPYGHLARRALYHSASAKALHLLTLKFESTLPTVQPPINGVLMHPGCGSAQSYKRWPIENYFDLIRIISERGIRCIVTFGPDEPDLYSAFSRLAGGNQNLALIQTPSFEKLASLLNSVRLVIASDSSIGHIAAFHAVETISLVGPSNPLKTMPLNSKLHVISAPIRPKCAPCITRNSGGGCGNPICMSTIPVGDVLQIVGRALEIAV
jgi:ADP-heptose:LPS heptosyltransferase